MMDFENKKFLIVGMGISGQGVAKFLEEKNFDYSILQLSKKDSYVNITKKPSKQYDFAVVSAGIDFRNKVVKNIKRKKIQIIGELDLVQNFLKGKIVSISGTNGKTTLVNFVRHLLKVAGRDVFMAGNCGRSILEGVDFCTNKTTNVLEISSYMLEKCPNFASDIACITNLSPDHVKHHGSLKKYYQAKLNLFENIKKNGTIVVNFDDAISVNYSRNLKCKKILFSTCKQVDGAYCKNGAFYFKGQKICFVKECNLLGEHNYSNICAGICIAKILKIENEKIAQAIKTFLPIEHRIENFAVFDGKVFINDSKATNLNSTICALRAVCGKKVLILGGLSKDESFKNLFKETNFDVENVVCYGQAGQAISKQIAKHFCKSNIFYARSFSAAVSMAIELTKCGQKCLLSPGCASFDQHKNFEERGLEFKKIVREFYAKTQN